MSLCLTRRSTCGTYCWNHQNRPEYCRSIVYFCIHERETQYAHSLRIELWPTYVEPHRCCPVLLTPPLRRQWNVIRRSRWVTISPATLHQAGVDSTGFLGVLTAGDPTFDPALWVECNRTQCETWGPAATAADLVFLKDCKRHVWNVTVPPPPPPPHIMQEIMRTRSEVHYDRQQVALLCYWGTEVHCCLPKSFHISQGNSIQPFQLHFHTFEKKTFCLFIYGINSAGA